MIGYHSQLTLDPDIGFEFFVLRLIAAEAALLRGLVGDLEEVGDRHRGEDRRAEARRARREQEAGVEAPRRPTGRGSTGTRAARRARGGRPLPRGFSSSSAGPPLPSSSVNGARTNAVTFFFEMSRLSL